MKNLLLADAFQRARKEVDLGREQYICNALIRLGRRGEISYSQAEQAIGIIGQRLGHPNDTVMNWLNRNVPEFRQWAARATDKEVNTQLRAYRLRWLDSLIGEFS